MKNEYSVPAMANFAKTLVDWEVDPLALSDQRETALTVPMKNNHDNSFMITFISILDLIII